MGQGHLPRHPGMAGLIRLVCFPPLRVSGRLVGAARPVPGFHVREFFGDTTAHRYWVGGRACLAGASDLLAQPGVSGNRVGELARARRVGN